MFVINRQRNLSLINKGYCWIVLCWLFLSNCYTRIVFGRHLEFSLLKAKWAETKKLKKTPNKQLSMFLHSVLYLDLNVGSAGLSIKADWRLIFDGFCIFKTHQISRHVFLHSDKDVKRRQVSSCNWGSNEILQYKRFKVTIFESFERL